MEVKFLWTGKIWNWEWLVGVVSKQSVHATPRGNVMLSSGKSSSVSPPTAAAAFSEPVVPAKPSEAD